MEPLTCQGQAAHFSGQNLVRPPRGKGLGLGHICDAERLARNARLGQVGLRSAILIGQGPLSARSGHLAWTRGTVK